MSLPHRPSRRRAVLVVPGSDEHKLLKALSSRVDEVVLDLEDAVAIDAKDQARDLVARILTATQRDPERSIAVRVNALGTSWAGADLARLGELDTVDSVVIPKVERAADLSSAAQVLAGHPATLQALVETPRGLSSIEEICTAGYGLSAVIIGYADLGAALGRDPNLPPQRWLAVQDQVLIAARAAGIEAIDGPSLGIADDNDFRERTRWAREAGFDGKWVLHPAQISTVTKEFTPDADAVAYARSVVDALEAAALQGRGAARIGNQMLDEAVAAAARHVLEKAGKR